MSNDMTDVLMSRSVPLLSSTLKVVVIPEDFAKCNALPFYRMMSKP